MPGIRKIAASFAASLAAIAGVTAFTALPASAAPGVESVKPSAVLPMANGCNLPTAPGAGSVFVASYSNCYKCTAVATLSSMASLGKTYYCTYNPNTNLNDLYYK